MAAIGRTLIKKKRSLGGMHSSHAKSTAQQSRTCAGQPTAMMKGSQGRRQGSGLLGDRKSVLPFVVRSLLPCPSNGWCPRVLLPDATHWVSLPSRTIQQPCNLATLQP